VSLWFGCLSLCVLTVWVLLFLWVSVFLFGLCFVYGLVFCLCVCVLPVSLCFDCSSYIFCLFVCLLACELMFTIYCLSLCFAGLSFVFVFLSLLFVFLNLCLSVWVFFWVRVKLKNWKRKKKCNILFKKLPKNIFIQKILTWNKKILVKKQNTAFAK